MARLADMPSSNTSYMMQVPGHARCLVDSGFASLKKLFQLRHIGPVGDGCQQVVSNQRRRALSGLAEERLAHVPGALCPSDNRHPVQ